MQEDNRSTIALNSVLNCHKGNSRTNPCIRRWVFVVGDVRSTISTQGVRKRIRVRER